MTEEIWLPCPEYEGRYEVSSHGRIRSLPRTEIAANGIRRTIRGGILNPSKNADGYPHVSLRKDGKLRLIRLHRLICRAFHGEPKAPCREAAHMDGDRANARAGNLKWVGKVQNHYHMRAHGTHPTGERHGQAKLNWEIVCKLRSMPKPVNAAALARTYGVSATSIQMMLRGKTWREPGFRSVAP